MNITSIVNSKEITLHLPLEMNGTYCDGFIDDLFFAIASLSYICDREHCYLDETNGFPLGMINGIKSDPDIKEYYIYKTELENIAVIVCQKSRYRCYNVSIG